MVISAVGVAGGLLAGYLAGLLSFKIKSRWCPRCGSTTNRIRERIKAVP